MRKSNLTIEVPIEEWDALSKNIIWMKDTMHLMMIKIKGLEEPESDKMMGKEVVAFLNRSYASLKNYHEDGTLIKQYDDNGKLFYWRKDVEEKYKQLYKLKTATRFSVSASSA